MEDNRDQNKLLYNILYVVFKRKIALITFFVFAFICILFISFLKTPTFRATTKILVRANPQQQVILFKDLATPGKDFSNVNPALNLIQILTSREMAREVVQNFSLDERLRQRKTEPETLRDIIKQFLVKAITYPITIARRLGLAEAKNTNYSADAVKRFIEKCQDISLEESTNVINVTIIEETPKISMDIANFMTEKLIAKTRELDKSTARNAHDFTMDKVATAGRNLNQAENLLLKFKEKENIISLEEEKFAKLKELHSVEEKYTAINVGLSEDKAKLKKMQEEISRQKRKISDARIAVSNPVLTDLKNSLQNLEIQLSGDLVKYADTSLNIRKLKAEATEIKNKIQIELKKITEDDIAVLYTIHPNLPNDYFKLIAQISAQEVGKSTLEEVIKKLKTETFSLSLKEIELKQINRSIETSEKLYTRLLDKYSELDIQKTSEIIGHDLKVIDKAFLPDDSKPDSPKWILVILMGFIASAALSFMAIFLTEYWDQSFKTPDEVEDRLGVTVLCTLPEIEKN